ncbi:MAG: DMT family transporter [Candidatus Firestonebacteria bacterium]
MNNKIKGSLYALIACVFWASAYVAPKYLIDTWSVQPLVIGALRFTLGGLILFAFAFARKDYKIIETAKNNFGYGLLLGALGMAGMFGFLCFSLKYTSTTNSAILMNTSGFLSVLLALFIAEKFTKNKALGVLLGLLGVYLVVNKGLAFNLFNSQTLKGDLLALVSALCWSGYTVASKKILEGKSINSLHLTALNCLLGGLMLFALSLLIGGFSFPLEFWPVFWILFLTVFATCVAYVLWYYALEKIDAGSASIFQFITPVLSAGLAFSFLGDRITIYVIIGMVFVFAGILFSSIEGRRRKTQIRSGE